MVELITLSQLLVRTYHLRLDRYAHDTYFFQVGQLCGCMGSFSPANSTTYMSGSGKSGG